MSSLLMSAMGGKQTFRYGASGRVFQKRPTAISNIKIANRSIY